MEVYDIIYVLVWVTLPVFREEYFRLQLCKKKILPWVQTFPWIQVA